RDGRTAQFLAAFQEWWWNFGYSKGLVIERTGLFLIAFFLLNIVFWKQLQVVYPIDQQYNFIDKVKKPALYSTQKYIRIFLYTCYVFFSVKIELSKIKIGNIGIVVYFFFQFMVGLGCLFFILNALLKLT